ncbi:MAG: alanine racemase [Nitrospinota bacterium]|nr:alanine racemase [Nitrospinota bacterium]
MKLPYPAWAEVDLDRLHHNVDVIHAAAGVPLLPVIKANAYGHGANVLAIQLLRRQEVAGLCVWTIQEAEALRREGIKGRIVALGGVAPQEARLAVELCVEPVVGSVAQAQALAGVANRRKPASVHLKVDTGMARLGADRQDAFDAIAKISRMEGLSLAGLMTHFAFAGENRKGVREQVESFEDLLGALRGAGKNIPSCHAANTAGIFLHPEARFQLVRPGIGLYGIQEFAGPDVGLKPVLSLKARVSWIRDVSKGQTVSYGGIWKSPGKRRVAVVSLGYADGYSRLLSNRVHGIINGKRTKQIGVICMDVSMFDITRTGAGERDFMTLIGSDGAHCIGALDLAHVMGTISYEILCGIGNRVRRIYHRSGKVDRKLLMRVF